MIIIISDYAQNSIQFVCFCMCINNHPWFVDELNTNSHLFAYDSLFFSCDNKFYDTIIIQKMEANFLYFFFFLFLLFCHFIAIFELKSICLFFFCLTNKFIRCLIYFFSICHSISHFYYFILSSFQYQLGHDYRTIFFFFFFKLRKSNCLQNLELNKSQRKMLTLIRENYLQYWHSPRLLAREATSTEVYYFTTKSSFALGKYINNFKYYQRI